MTDDLTALRRMAEENARIAQETGVGSGSIAFEPQAVLALLDRLERAERELEVAMAPHSDCVESGERVGAQIDDLRSRAERAAAAKARGEALIEAVQAHRNLHRAYASTSVCRGGIGGQAITSHCGEVCDNYADPKLNPRHLWDEHDSTRWYTDPEGWNDHEASCKECKGDDDD